MSHATLLLPLGRGDLEGLRQVITLYLRTLDAQGTLARDIKQRRQVLLELRTRIGRARLAQDDPVCIPLALAEWQVLKKALAGCAWVIRQRVPASPERDDLLNMLESMREKIAQIVSSSLN